MKHLPHILLEILGLSLATFCAAAQPSPPPAWDTFADTWVATDALGRALPTNAIAGNPKPDKTVGIFYFAWLGQHDRAVYDISKILAANPRDPQWGPERRFHFWGQPLFGYYQSGDEFVIRKHAQMLTDAGVDVIILDVTNASTYPNVYLTICKVFDALRNTGQRTPQICFIANSASAKTVHKLYDDFYAKNLYPDLWFRWNGKPLILAPGDGLRPEVRDFFTIRRSWAWSKDQQWFGDGRDKWTWLDHFPQEPGWHTRPTEPEELSVSVAEHPVSNIGRSFHDRRQPSGDTLATDRGLYFAEQWRRALDVNPQFLFITGWNEWVAQRFIAKGKGSPHMLGHPTAPGDTFFVDQYSQEFSRDIEPMTGGHGDNYYYQMIDNIRRYKGTRALAPVAAKPITIDGQFDDWRDVQPEFRDTLDDPVHRDAEGYDPRTRYTNTTGRNDLIAAKVSYDATNVYFYIRTKDPISLHTDPNWMLLYIDADNNPKTGWLGYDLLIDHGKARRNVAGKYEWTDAADIASRVAGNEMELAIPRAALGITHLPATLDFKWADNIQQTGQAADFTLNGDAAPNDRFNYRAVLNND
ncbi:MAG: hypothetical protein JWN40_2681 [Phycisphaerales bacterium]|nr:hypothetical protein [Phycisphaerales bacterium]